MPPGTDFLPDHRPLLSPPTFRAAGSLSARLSRAGVPGAGGPGRGAWLRRGRRPASLMVLLVAPLVFRAPQPGLPTPPAPSTPVGPGVLTCACASARCPARPRHRPRAPQPGPAAPPAPSTPLGPLRLLLRGASARCPARPRHRPPAPRPDLAFCSSPVPSGPSGALHTSGAWCAGVWLGALSRCPPWPCHRPPVPRPGLAFWLVISGSALLREALHWLVASAMLRYLVHRFLTQHIPTHAHGALSQPIRDRAEWVTAVASHQLALYQVTSRVLDRKCCSG